MTNLFEQVPQHIPRNSFNRLVRKHGVERCSKRSASWSHFVTMLFFHLAHARPLREICYVPPCCNGRLRHPGVLDDGPKRSTLVYANIKEGRCLRNSGLSLSAAEERFVQNQAHAPPVNPDLDGNDRPSYRQVAPLPVEGGMAFLQHGRHVPDEPLDLPESQGLAR